MDRVQFDPGHNRLDLYLDFPRGARFGCPAKDCPQRECPVHDTDDKTWRHMDFFQQKAFLHVRLPRVRCPEHGVRQAGVPWAREGSGFTLLFEALLLQFAAAMPVRRIAGMVGEHDTRIWRVLDHHVAAARGRHYVSIWRGTVGPPLLPGPPCIPDRYHSGMSIQIAVRLPDEIVAFIDEQVGRKQAPSRAAVVLRALERERRRQLAARDAEILASAAGEPDDMDSLARHAANLPTDLD